MSLRKGTPGRGGESRRESFSYTSVGSGLKGSFGAWLAGQPYWCEEAHEYHKQHGPTKPCLHWMTEGQLRCARCRVQPKVTCLAWVPLYREWDGKPIIVIVHKSGADLLSKLRYPDYCLVGRFDSVSSVFVRASDSPLSLSTQTESRKKPVDVTGDLLDMWRMPDLNEWLRGRKVEQPAEAPAEAAPLLTSQGRVFDPMHRAAAERYGRDGASDADDIYSQALKGAVKRGTKGSANGNGKHKEGAADA